MSEQLKDDALKIIVSACEAHEGNFELAAQQIKQKLDEYSGKFWHVCVGEAYGFKVEHDNGKIIYLLFGNIGVVIWKCS